jgi:hypothetical protein
LPTATLKPAFTAHFRVLRGTWTICRSNDRLKMNLIDIFHFIMMLGLFGLGIIVILTLLQFGLGI